jgi:hypothetical protein
MDLLLIAPEILFLELPADAHPVSERPLREAPYRSVNWREQQRAWEVPKASFYPLGTRSV